MNIHSRPVLYYRWLTLLLAQGYCIYQLIFGDYSNDFGPFRFLTIWALFVSCYAMSRMVARSEGQRVREHDATAACAAVLNVMVLYLYWSLYLEDPALVNNNAENVWHQEYYLHGVGPALQIIDALFIGRVFRRFWRAIIPLMVIIGLYIYWAEIVLQRVSDTPVGDVTSGLPYPFMNSMTQDARSEMYLTYLGTAVGLLVIFWVLGGLIQVIFRPSASNKATSPAR